MNATSQFTYILLGGGFVVFLGFLFAILMTRMFSEAMLRIETVEGKLGALNALKGPVKTSELADHIEATLLEHHILRTSWREFRETMVVDPKTTSIHQTRSFKHFINPGEVADLELNMDVHGRFSGWIVQVGLAITFIFIGTGLSTVAGPDSNGPTELINSLSGKFTASICATLAAIGISVLESKNVKTLKDAYFRVADLIDSKFRYMTADHVLATELHQILDAVKESNSSRIQLYQSLGLISENVQETSIAVRQMSGDLSDVLRDTMTEAMAQAQGGLHEQLLSAMSSLTKDFSESLTGHAETYFRNTREQMELISASLSSALTSADGFGAVINSHLTQFDTVIQSARDIISLTNVTIERFAGLTKDVDVSTAAFEKAGAELAKFGMQLDAAVNRLDDGVATFSRCIDDAGKRTNAWYQQTADNFENVAKAISVSLGHQHRLTESQHGTMENLSDAISLFGEALRPVIQGLQGSLDEIRVVSTTNLDKVLEDFANTQSQVLRKLNENLGGDIIRLTDALEEAMKKVKAA
ncbi:MAG: hypothetical protein FJ146_16700 [Deltaproteobacteria bacterium]|nr:hypothetical protein [Deltaproteobacteria bacterium]